MERTGGFVTGGEPAPLFYCIQPLILWQLCLLLLQFVEVVIGLRVGSRYIIAYSHSWECFVILYYFLNELHEFNWGMLHNGCDFVSIWCSTFAKTWKIHLLNPFVKEIKELRLHLVRVKVFPENRYFLEMLFSWKENVFMCLVAFQKMFRKIFSNVWLCSWKYHRKHIFYLLLTFSHIFSVTKWIHNIIHSSKYKQNPEKNHQIRTHEGEIAIAISIEIGEIAIAIDANQRSHDCADRRGAGDHAMVFGMLTDHADRRSAGDHANRSLSLSLSGFCLRGFFLSVALSLFCTCYGKCLKVKQFYKMIFGSTSANFGQTEIIFLKIYFP